MSVDVLSNKVDEAVSTKNKNLYTVTGDVAYAAAVQPYVLEKYNKSKGSLHLTYTEERLMSRLLECLFVYPEQFDTIFNVEVNAPYDYQVADYTERLAEEVNRYLSREDEISDEQIEKIKVEVYNSRTYDLPISVILTEMEQNKEYFAYLMSSPDKIKITKKQYQIAKDLVSNHPFVIDRDEGMKKTKNVQKVHDPSPGGIAKPVLLSTNVPIFANFGDSLYMGYMTYVDRIEKNKLNFEAIRQSFIHLDIGIAMMCLSAKEIIIQVDVFDGYGNHMNVRLSEGIRKGIVKEVEGIARDASLLMSKILHPKKLLADKHANGSLII